MKILFTLKVAVLSVFLWSCASKAELKSVETEINDLQLAYWFNNEAEISSFELNQARYGEIHKGKAVLIFVTEPFSLKNLVKADNPDEGNVSVLKLNFTKKFNTGIYPYSLMTSTFFPFHNGNHSLKISASSQEWCGHTYMELKNEDQFDISISSYFEGESIENTSMGKELLEDDFWTVIRLNPDKLPVGELKVIPSFFYLRLRHKEIKAYQCTIEAINLSDSIANYKIIYPELDRQLSIQYKSTFPYQIVSWEESYISGWGENEKRLTTTATLIKRIKSAYWERHFNLDLKLRAELGLE